MAPADLPSQLAAAVRFHRRAADLSQTDLARLAGVGKTVVYDIEQGKPTVRLQTLLRILGVLNMELEWQSPLRQAFEQAPAEVQRHAKRARPGSR